MFHRIRKKEELNLVPRFSTIITSFKVINSMIPFPIIKISSPSFHQPFNQPNSTAESTLSTLLDSERYLRAVHILSLPFQIISLYYAFNKRGTARCGRLRVPRASQVFSTFTIRLRRGRSFLEGY